MNPGWNKQYLTIAAVFLLLVAVGIISYGGSMKTDNELLEARDAVRAFRANGLDLSPMAASTDADPAIDGVFPVKYQVDKSEDSIAWFTDLGVSSKSSRLILSTPSHSSLAVSIRAAMSASSSPPSTLK
jgi:hypothetical protein